MLRDAYAVKTEYNAIKTRAEVRSEASGGNNLIYAAQNYAKLVLTLEFIF